MTDYVNLVSRGKKKKNLKKNSEWLRMLIFGEMKKKLHVSINKKTYGILISKCL